MNWNLIFSQINNISLCFHLHSVNEVKLFWHLWKVDRKTTSSTFVKIDYDSKWNLFDYDLLILNNKNQRNIMEINYFFTHCCCCFFLSLYKPFSLFSFTWSHKKLVNNQIFRVENQLSHFFTFLVCEDWSRDVNNKRTMINITRLTETGDVVSYIHWANSIKYL